MRCMRTPFLSPHSPPALQNWLTGKHAGSPGSKAVQGGGPWPPTAPLGQQAALDDHQQPPCCRAGAEGGSRGPGEQGRAAVSRRRAAAQLPTACPNWRVESAAIRALTVPCLITLHSSPCPQKDRHRFVADTESEEEVDPDSDIPMSQVSRQQDCPSLPVASLGMHSCRLTLPLCKTAAA